MQERDKLLENTSHDDAVQWHRQVKTKIINKKHCSGNTTPTVSSKTQLFCEDCILANVTLMQPEKQQNRKQNPVLVNKKDNGASLHSRSLTAMSLNRLGCAF